MSSTGLGVRYLNESLVPKLFPSKLFQQPDFSLCNFFPRKLFSFPSKRMPEDRYYRLTLATEQDLEHDAIVRQLGLRDWVEYQEIKRLSIRENNTGRLPDLPQGLTHLLCPNSQLTSLPDLPETLIRLDCHDNLLTSLPTLPSTVNWLWCFGNQLTGLPDLPDGMTHLECGHQELTSLPRLPSKLINIDCSGCQLTNLPDLPEELTYLNCSDNLLEYLPDFSDAMKELQIAGNKIPIINRTILPSAMTTLDVSGNPMSTLPFIPRRLVPVFDSTKINQELTSGQILDLQATMKRIVLNPHTIDLSRPYEQIRLELKILERKVELLEISGEDLDPKDIDRRWIAAYNNMSDNAGVTRRVVDSPTINEFERVRRAVKGSKRYQIGKPGYYQAKQSFTSRAQFNDSTVIRPNYLDKQFQNEMTVGVYNSPDTYSLADLVDEIGWIEG